MTRIAGIIYPSAFQVTDLINTMGFVSEGNFFRHKNLELGAWKTSIFTNEKKTVRAIFEGQIYNASLLIETLKKQGFKFTQANDTELIIHAYEAWGERFLARLNGPFALAVFDEEQEILLIARDRLGQKPLYWTAKGGYWLFSTEIKGFLTTGVVSQTPSLDALSSYLYFGFVPQDLSPIQGVNKILPGHYMKVDLNRQTLIGQYWSLSQQFESVKSLSQEKVYDQFGKIMEEAVHVSLPKEGDVGSFLNGDLGSSSLSWFLQEQLPPQRLHFYTAHFEKPDPVFDEIQESLSLSLQSMEVRVEEVLQNLPAIVWNLDEPIADLNVVRTWQLAQFASKTCHSTYTSAGWEEMLGGTPPYFITTYEGKPPLAHFLARLPQKLLDYVLFPLLDLLRSDYKYRILRNVDINREQVAYLMESALFKGKNRKKVSPFLHRFFDPEVFAQRFHRLTTLSGKINPSLYYDAKTHLPDSLLLQYERLLQSHSLNMITPYLDYRLVEFLARVPEEIKFEGAIEGALLKHLMRRRFHVSPPYLEAVPISEIWRKKIEFRHIFTQLTNGRLVEEGFISAKWIRHKLHYATLKTKTFEQLWAILVMEIWFRLYINRPLDASLSQLSIEELFSR